MDKVGVKRAAVSVGVLWSFYVLMAGWGAIFGWGTSFVNLFANLYIGYGPSFLGGIIGAIWGFFDGAVAGAIIALVYNCSWWNQKKGRR